MTEALYSSQLQDGNWAMAAMIELRSIPDSMDPNVLSDLIADCYEISSMEIFARSGSERGKTEVYLLLRNKSDRPAQLQLRMEEYVQTMLSRLEFKGFEAVLLSKEETEAFKIAPGADNQRLICVPGENLRGVHLCYCPGGYSLAEGLDISYLFSVLRDSENPKTGLSLQIRKDSYTPSELYCLNVNREWILANFGNWKEGQYAAQVYQNLIQQQNAPLFFATLSVWGENTAISNLCSSIRRCGYGILPLSEDLFYGMDYLTYGESTLASYAQSFGHVLENGQVVPAGLERMNYLTGENGIRLMLQGAFPAGKLGGMKITRGSRDKETVPDQLTGSNGLMIGKCESLDQDISLPLSQLTKHMVVPGMPGSGKTSLLFWVLHELAEKNIPFLAIEPTKTEYRELTAAISDLNVFTPGRRDINPIMFNPFLPPKGITLEQYLPSLISAFQMAFSMTTPLDVIFPKVVRICYTEYGWRNDSTSDSPEAAIFGMKEFIGAYEKEIKYSNYDPESKQNLESGGVYRLNSLLNADPYMFDTDRSFPVERFLQEHTVIELDAIDNQEQKALFLALLLLQLKLVIRKNQIKDSRLKNVILIDEAHILLESRSTTVLKNESDPSGKLREYLLDMIKVNRAFGTGMIFADQSIAVLKDFINYSNVKIIMHVESSEERAFVTRNMNLSPEQYERITGLKTGEFYLYCEETDQPILVKAPDTKSELSLPPDMDDNTLHQKMNPVYEKPFSACKCRKECSLEVRIEAEYIAGKLINKMQPLLQNSEALENYIKQELDSDISKLAEDSNQEKRLARCARMMIERMLQAEHISQEKESLVKTDDEVPSIFQNRL